MSLGCANEAGNAGSWASLINATSSQCSATLNRKGLSCQDHKGLYAFLFDFFFVVRNIAVRSLTDYDHGRAVRKSMTLIQDEKVSGFLTKTKVLFIADLCGLK